MHIDLNRDDGADPGQSAVFTVRYTSMIKDRGLAIFFESDPVPIPADHALNIRITRPDATGIETAAYREFARKVPEGEVIAFLLPLMTETDVPLGSMVSIIAPAALATVAASTNSKKKRKSPVLFVEREFRLHWGMIAFVVAAAVLFGVNALYLYRKNGASFYAVAGILMTLLGLAGSADALLTRIVLRQEEIEIVKNFRHRVYPRSNFVAVTWSKGCPVSLTQGDGGRVDLPEVSPAGLRFVNTLNAWLKRQS